MGVAADDTTEVAGEAELYETEATGSRIRLLIGKDLIERNRTLSWARPLSIGTRIGG